VAALLLLPLVWPLELPRPLAAVTVSVGWPGLPALEQGDHGRRPRVDRTAGRQSTGSAVTVLHEVTPEPATELVAEPLMVVSNGVADDTSGGAGAEATGVPEGVEGGGPDGAPWGQPGSCLECVGAEARRDYDRAPVLLRSVRPLYPPEAFVQKVEGTVRLEILIDATGRVARTRVLESIPALDPAAVACVEQWRFEPARKAGQAVPALAQAPVRFTIY